MSAAAGGRGYPRVSVPLPRPVAPISAAVAAGDVVYLSGCVALDPVTGQVVGTTVQEQAREIMAQIEATLKRLGADLSDVVRCVCYLTDAADLAALNEVFQAAFGADPPARSTVVTGLALPGLLVEIEATAYRPGVAGAAGADGA